MADWARLIPDILFMIVNRIDQVEDFTSFSYVCCMWRHAATVCKYSMRLRSLQPHRSLMFPSRSEGLNNKEIYSFTRDKIYRFSLRGDYNGNHSTYTNGWILTESRGREMNLINPFSRQVISLPPAFNKEIPNNLFFLCIKRAVLSSCPSFFPDDYIIMVIYGWAYGSGLCFWKSGDREWTMLNTSAYYFEDIIYCRGQFYAVSDNGMIYVCDVRGVNPRVAVTLGKINAEKSNVNFSLARKTDSDSSLLIIATNYRKCDGNSIYRIYKLDLSGNGGVEKLNDLGARTIFLSRYGSFCVEQPKFPHGIIEASHIYFHDFDCSKSYRRCENSCPVIEREHKRGMMMHIHNLKNEKVEDFFYSLGSLSVLPSV